MNDISTWDVARNLLEGARWTLGLSLLAFVLGGISGLALLFARIAKRTWLRRLAQGYIEVFQGTPLLMQLFIIFFGSSLIGVELSPWLAAALGLTLFTSAYLGEIWRACVESVAKGQWEASASLALSHFEQMRYVILPQAFRNMLPVLLTQTVILFQDVSLVYAIGATDFFGAADKITQRDLRPVEMYTTVAVVYFVLCFALSRLVKYLQSRIAIIR